MSNYVQMVARQRKWMLYLLMILVLGAGFAPGKSVFLGLLLGSVISFYNLFLLQRKISDFAEKVKREERPNGLGTVSRLAAVALGVIIALRYEAYFNMVALVIGFMSSYLIILIDFLVVRWKR